MRQIGLLSRMALAAGILLGAGGSALAARVALVIGNNEYVHLPRLQKAVGDAEAVAAALKSLGFSVTEHRNLDDRATTRALAAFVASIAAGDEAAVFFSGHGVAIDGKNYLLPIDLEEPEPGQGAIVTELALDAGELIEKIREKQPKHVFAVLDACRDNPFAGTGKSIGQKKGLARMEANTGAFILFAAGPGEQALDRLGSNDRSQTSVFTRVFVKQLETPGLTLQAIAKATQREVRTLALTVKHQQFPDYSDRTIEDLVLLPARPGLGPTPDPQTVLESPPPADPDVDSDAEDHAAFAEAERANTIRAYEGYVSAFPDGKHVAEAEWEIRRMAASSEPEGKQGGLLQGLFSVIPSVDLKLGPRHNSNERAPEPGVE